MLTRCSPDSELIWQNITITQAGNYTFTVSGAAGGTYESGAQGGFGVVLSATISLRSNEVVYLVVGCKGDSATSGGSVAPGGLSLGGRVAPGGLSYSSPTYAAVLMLYAQLKPPWAEPLGSALCAIICSASHFGAFSCAPSGVGIPAASKWMQGQVCVYMWEQSVVKTDITFAAGSEKHAMTMQVAGEHLSSPLPMRICGFRLWPQVGSSLMTSCTLMAHQRRSPH